MANRNTKQHVQTLSTPRQFIIDMAESENYTRNDYRVFLLLMSILEGYTIPKNAGRDYVDPKNFRSIDIDQISETLNLKKKKVKESITKLHDDGIIEYGENDTIKNGCRFTY